MSRAQRVKDALRSTVDKLRSQIEESHKNGKIPQDYSLGFCNALIFAEHHINMRAGDPKFYDRTTSIGSLPKPVALKSDQAIEEDGIYQSLIDTIVLNAYRLKEAAKAGEDIADSLAVLILALDQKDLFIEQFEANSKVAEVTEKGEECGKQSKEIESKNDGVETPELSQSEQDGEEASRTSDESRNYSASES